MTISLSDHFSYSKLLRFVFPSIVMMIFTSVYSVVDGLFISNFAGKIPFAAINLIYPFIMILGGMGFMLGTGGTALVAKNLGEGKKEKANAIFSMLVGVALLLGSFLAIIGFLFLPQVADLLGASQEMRNDCILYGRIVISFIPIFMVQNIFQSFLIVAEKPKLGLYITVASGVTNMLLDALFILGFRWGLAGAALATGIGQCVGGLIPLLYFIRPNSSLLRLHWQKPEWRPIVQSCTNGSSELMSTVSGSLIGMLYNLQLMKYIGEDGVSAFGVLMYIQFIFIAIFIGYAIGVSPIVGYHYGSENHRELKNLLKKSLILMSGGGILLAGIAYFLAPVITAVFVGYDAHLYRITVDALHIFAISFLLGGVNIFSSAFFTALNNGFVSAAISFMRTLLFQGGAVLTLPLLWGVDGIWWSNGYAEIFAFLLSLYCLYRFRNKYHYL